MLHITVLATAYCLAGLTRSEMPVQPGIVAVDPRVIPFHTKIRIFNDELAGLVGRRVLSAEDSGAWIKGGHVDVYMCPVRKAIAWGAKKIVIGFEPIKF